MSVPNLKAPKGETFWVLYFNSKKVPVFGITSKISSREYYYLYEISGDGELKKLGRSKSPNELEEKYNVRQGMK